MIIETCFLKTNRYTTPVLSYIYTNTDNHIVDSIKKLINKILINRFNIIVSYDNNITSDINRILHDKNYEIIFDRLENVVPNYIIYKVFKEEKVINYYETNSIEQFRM